MFKNTKGFDPFALVIGILAIGLSFLIIKDPAASLISIIWVFAIISIIEGILKLVELSSFSWLGALSGILNIIIGVIILFEPVFGEIIIWITLALWFIIDSLYELYFSRLFEKTDKGYFWLLVVLGVIGVILGVILLFHPLLTASLAVFLVAFYFLLFGILSVIRAF